MLKRPSYAELNKKLLEAKELLRKGKILYCDNNKVDRELLDLVQLGFDLDSLPDLIQECINEILQGNILKAYEAANGKSPPTKSFESQAQGKEYWPFCWVSEIKHLRGKTMYLKFVILNENYLYLSFHEDDKRRKK